MLRPLYVLMFKLLGWRIVGAFPSHLKKYIVAVGPHTSSWDFIVGVAARSILRMRDAHFLGKSQLFKPPFGWFFRWLGGHPVERTKSHEMVDQVAKIFDAHEYFILALAPEGTRKKVDKLRTGFYFIAKQAKVPIIPVGFDFAKRAVIIGDPYYTTQDSAGDIAKITDFYRNISGKNPELGIS